MSKNNIILGAIEVAGKAYIRMGTRLAPGAWDIAGQYTPYFTALFLLAALQSNKEKPEAAQQFIEFGGNEGSQIYTRAMRTRRAMERRADI